MAKKLVLMGMVAVLVSACSGDTSPKVQSLQRKDKQLSCKEVLLEMNEAEFYRTTAQKNKGPGLKSVLMPLGYISTYMSAEEAINASGARIDYLDRIYQIMGCEADARGGSGGVQQQSTSSSEAIHPGGGGALEPEGQYMDQNVNMPSGGKFYPAPGQVQYHEEPQEGPSMGFYPSGMYW
ncbi:MAG: hypothetical protein K0R63_1503 [Rickettsiales bacterium]|jgi:hypothetical protein|nr:hypothetical protein [Rickettsiales bacterium]